MKIIIGGGTGFVGTVLIPELLQAGHELYVIGRDKEKIKSLFKDKVTACHWDELASLNPDLFTAIINLCGENISDKRWSAKVKEQLLTSRLFPTEKLVQWAAKAKINKPHLYNASAVSIYGLQKTLPAYPIDEDEPTPHAPSCFATNLVQQWEHTALSGEQFAVPVTLMRFGVVLKKNEGMLKKLELPAAFGLGATLGSGEQPLSWIHYLDLVHAIKFLLEHPEIRGPVNCVAQEPVSQKSFNTILAECLHRPTFLKLPAWFVRMAFGQMGEELLLSGQAASPRRLLDAQFTFNYPDLRAALLKEFS